ncbi:MAG: dienelactone hydrolase family protein [Luteolibacter sp.]
MKKCILTTLLCAACHLPVGAEIVTKSVKYEHEGISLEGFHAYDGSAEGKRPGILIIHQWTGLTDYEKMRAVMFAELGYNVFAADIYGKGIRPQPPEAGKYAGKYKSDRGLYRARMLAGLDVLKGDERTDHANVAAIGYCFGGTGVLELARANADITAVASFHGGLGSAEGMEAKKGEVSPKIICFHGAIDPYVSTDEVETFQKEMEDAAADLQFVSFSGAVHAFSQKMAGDDPSKGFAYDAKADKRSWEYLKAFLEDVFEKS